MTVKSFTWLFGEMYILETPSKVKHNSILAIFITFDYLSLLSHSPAFSITFVLKPALSSKLNALWFSMSSFQWNKFWEFSSWLSFRNGRWCSWLLRILSWKSAKTRKAKNINLNFWNTCNQKIAKIYFIEKSSLKITKHSILRTMLLLEQKLRKIVKCDKNHQNLVFDQRHFHNVQFSEKSGQTFQSHQLFGHTRHQNFLRFLYTCWEHFFFPINGEKIMKIHELEEKLCLLYQKRFFLPIMVLCKTQYFAKILSKLWSAWLSLKHVFSLWVLNIEVLQNLTFLLQFLNEKCSQIFVMSFVNPWCHLA